MAKKDNQGIRPFIIKFFLWLVLMGCIGFGTVKGAAYYLHNSPYLTVQSVMIDPELQFINAGDLRNVLGANIFEIDLNRTQRNLSAKYPQASDLKVIRKFPNQIAVVAKKRQPFARIAANGKIVVLDQEGVFLFAETLSHKDLPLITGFRFSSQTPVQGKCVDAPEVVSALMMVDRFLQEKSLASYAVKEINVANFSKVEILLTNQLNVFVDRVNIAQKFKVLGVVLSQGNLDLKEINYIDLRFKEPIIGKK